MSYATKLSLSHVITMKNTTAHLFRNPQALILYSIALLLFLFICFFYLSITHDDQVVGYLSDDAIYLLMAEMYSFWSNDINPVLNFIRSEYYFPPLYPILLGLLGANSSSPALASSITTVFLLSNIFIFGLWIWRETRQFIPTIILPLIFAFLPSTIIMSQGLWSEFLFMCFIYGAFICLSPQHPDGKQWLLAALLLSMASLTRSIGMIFIAAYCLLLFIKKIPRPFLLSLISVTPFIGWSLYRKQMTGDSVYIKELLLIFNSEGNFLGNVLEHLYHQPVVMLDSLFYLFSFKQFDGDNQNIYLLLILVLLLFSSIGFLIRLKQKRIDAITVPLYLGTVLIWPYTGTYFVSRFLFPLLPLFIFYLWVSRDYFTKSTLAKNIVIPLCLITFTILAYPSTNKFINRAFLNTEPELMPYRRSRAWLLADTDDAAIEVAIRAKNLIEVLKKLKPYVNKNDCIFAFQTPMVMIHTQRMSRKLPLPYTSDEQFKAETSQCRYILATFLVDLNGNYPAYYPLSRIPDEPQYITTPLIIRFGNKEQPIAFLVEQTSFKE